MTEPQNVNFKEVAITKAILCEILRAPKLKGDHSVVQRITDGAVRNIRGKRISWHSAKGNKKKYTFTWEPDSMDAHLRKCSIIDNIGWAGGMDPWCMSCKQVRSAVKKFYKQMDNIK